jgi:protein-tyrosine phosphatase
MEQVYKNLYRGPRPKSLKQLKDAGVGCVISLQSGIFEVLKTDEYETINWAKSDIDHHEIKNNDITPPSREDVRRFFKILADYHPGDVKIYVHCMAGVDRTGFMIACFRMIAQGWSFDEAWKEMKEKGSHYWYRWWKLSLRKFEKITLKEIL